jgi:hypothetical protein
VPQVRRRFLLGLVAATLYASLAFVYLWPIHRVHGERVTPSALDPLFTVYVLKWVGHQARLGFPELWNANVFYPAPGALSFSEPFLLPGLLIAPFANAISGYNLLLFASFVLAGLAVWWVLLAGGSSPVAALFGGAMYAFAPFRWMHLNHLAMLLAAAIPLTIWSFDRLLAERTPRRAALFLLFYALNLGSSLYFAYMVLFALLAVLLSRAAEHRRELLRPAALRVLAPAAALAAALTAALFLPYLQLSRRMPMQRDEAEVVANAAALTSYLSPAPENRYSPRPPRALWRRSRLPLWERPFERVENSLFPGILASVFALAGGAAIGRRRRASAAGDGGHHAAASAGDAVDAPAAALSPARRLVLAALLLVAAAAVVVGDLYTLRLDRDTALGRWLPPATPATWLLLGSAFAVALSSWACLRRRWRGRPLLRRRASDPWERGVLLAGAFCLLLSFPLVYVPLMQLLPGLDGMRVPARFAAILGVAVVYLAARGIDGTLARIAPPARRALAVAGLALFLVLELWPRPLRWVPIPRDDELAPVYHWLAGRDDVRALLEIPMKAGGRELPYMYAATLHWKPIANGYSGFLPPSYERLSAAMGRSLPGAAALDLAAAMGVSHVVVHEERLGAPRVEAWARAIAPRLQLVHVAGADRVYRLRGAPAQ